LRRRNWPIALAIFFVAQLVWYLLYTRHVVQSLRANHETLSQVYGYVQGEISAGTKSPDQILFELQGILLNAEVPIIVSGPGDTILAVSNLPFEADLTLPEDQDRVRAYARRMDSNHPPQGIEDVQLIHLGDPPEIRGLRWIPFFQAGGLVITAFLGILSIRVQRRSEAERAWTAMARELAHQLGTPISSLQGWSELLRMPTGERPPEVDEGEIAREIEADLVRLERISHRFELIGREPTLAAVDLGEVLSGLKQYLEARLPRMGMGVTLEVDMEADLPPVQGSRTLLTWALENLVKNSLDALGGKGGSIRILARRASDSEVLISVSDTGPGVPPEVRSALFEPGVTTKERGWGVGLALTRRIVEGAHKGRIVLGDEGPRGAIFHIHLPVFRGEV
jgi:signal transduction histidine kinase